MSMGTWLTLRSEYSLSTNPGKERRGLTAGNLRKELTSRVHRWRMMERGATSNF